MKLNLNGRMFDSMVGLWWREADRIDTRKQWDLLYTYLQGIWSMALWCDMEDWEDTIDFLQDIARERKYLTNK